jgi:hypothetical protein
VSQVLVFTVGVSVLFRDMNTRKNNAKCLRYYCYYYYYYYCAVGGGGGGDAADFLVSVLIAQM